MTRLKSYYQRLKYLPLITAFFFVFIIIACTNNSEVDPARINQPSVENNQLIIWWEKGFNFEEDEAFRSVVSHWEQKTGNKSKLSFYPLTELPQKVERAVKTGNTPDIMMGYVADLSLNPILAWEGKLADVSDLIEPSKSLYPEAVLQSINFYNKVEGKRSYYGVPINQAIIHIFYWQKLLQQVGRSQSDIPREWDAFWQFWQQVQVDLNTEQSRNIYGLGLPFSIGSVETYFLFEQILEAYNVPILDSKGQLLIDKPQVRQGIIKCLDWYTSFYQKGYVPPEAVNWLNPDNNRNLLNRIVVMTPNLSLSIPAVVRQDPDTYYNKLGILEFPNKPNGQPMRYLVSIRQAVLFANSPHQKEAKDFLRYLIQPETIAAYLKASGSRTLPVLKSVWSDPFWTKTNDPYISTARKTLIEGQTRPFYFVQNPVYSRVLKENVWGKALNRIVVDGITTEQAADEAIEGIEKIFNQ